MEESAKDAADEQLDWKNRMMLRMPPAPLPSGPPAMLNLMPPVARGWTPSSPLTTAAADPSSSSAYDSDAASRSVAFFWFNIADVSLGAGTGLILEDDAAVVCVAWLPSSSHATATVDEYGDAESLAFFLLRRAGSAKGEMLLLLAGTLPGRSSTLVAAMVTVLSDLDASAITTPIVLIFFGPKA